MKISKKIHHTIGALFEWVIVVIIIFAFEIVFGRPPMENTLDNIFLVMSQVYFAVLLIQTYGIMAMWFDVSNKFIAKYGMMLIHSPLIIAAIFVPLTLINLTLFLNNFFHSWIP